jgi:hypothetical protein
MDITTAQRKATAKANMLGAILGAEVSDLEASTVRLTGGENAGVIQFTLTKGDIIRNVTIRVGETMNYEIGDAEWNTINHGNTAAAMNKFLAREFA